MARKDKKENSENLEKNSSETLKNTETEQTVPEDTDEISELKAELEKKEALAAENLDRYQRTLAEFDNFRKRTLKEKASMYDDGVKDTIEKLLPVIDNFERASLSVTKKDDPVYQGLEMIFKQIKTFFDDLGVTEIDCIGQKFDHNVHFAVATVDDENCESGTVVEELQKGYKYKDKIVRYSMVKVAN